MKSEHKIKWATCGVDRMDRRGSIGPKEVVQVFWHGMKKTFEVKFHHAAKGNKDTVEEAKAFAQEHVGEWIAEREAKRLSDEEEQREKTRKANEKAQRLEAVIAKLAELGIEANGNFGFVGLTIDVGEALVSRLGNRGGNG